MMMIMMTATIYNKNFQHQQATALKKTHTHKILHKQMRLFSVLRFPLTSIEKYKNREKKGNSFSHTHKMNK